MPKKTVTKSRALTKEEQAAQVSAHFDQKGRRVFQLITRVNDPAALPGREGKLRSVDNQVSSQLKLF